MQKDETSQTLCDNLNEGLQNEVGRRKLHNHFKVAESGLQNKLARGNFLTTSTNIKPQHGNVAQHLPQMHYIN